MGKRWPSLVADDDGESLEALKKGVPIKYAVSQLTHSLVARLLAG